MLKVLTIFGTRPEAIKLAPILVGLRQNSNIKSYSCVTAQHRQMLDQVLNIFDVVPDIDLNLMRSDQALSDLTARVMSAVDKVLCNINPDIVLVQGDTTTVMAAAMASFYRKIAVGHVEAGLRSGNIYSPFPEEMNRRAVSLIASYHFAPTEEARVSLLKEGIPEKNVYLTGNTVIDALKMITSRPCPDTVSSLLSKLNGPKSSNPRKLILITAHRRENFGAGIENICRGLKKLVERNNDIAILYPVHHNPNVKEPVSRMLGNIDRVVLCDPMEYDVMAHMMNASHIILTDSGGIQEEAPSLGKPVLVMRSETERPEGISAGVAKLVGTDVSAIIAETERLLHDEAHYRGMALTANPYGDGKSAARIVDIINTLNL